MCIWLSSRQEHWRVRTSIRTRAHAGPVAWNSLPHVRTKTITSLQRLQTKTQDLSKIAWIPKRLQFYSPTISLTWVTFTRFRVSSDNFNVSMFFFNRRRRNIISVMIDDGWWWWMMMMMRWWWEWCMLACRKRKFEEQMQLMSWKVRFEDIRFTKRNVKSMSSSKVRCYRITIIIKLSMN